MELPLSKKTCSKGKKKLSSTSVPSKYQNPNYLSAESVARALSFNSPQETMARKMAIRTTSSSKMLVNKPLQK